MSRKRDSIQSNESASDYVNKHRQSDDPHLHLNRRITENNFDADQNPSRLDNVRVVCRFRPPSAREIRYSQKHCIPDDPPVIEGCQVITINRPPSKETSRPNRKARKSKFFRTCLDDVFAPDATQKEIFKLVGQPTILSCLEGFNNTVFAYGQSGSGKTYTMFGPETRHTTIDQFGLIPRCFIYLFQKLNESLVSNGGHLQEYKVHLELLQIYKSKLLDLLNPHSSAQLVIKTDFNDDSIIVQNLRSLRVNNVEEVFAVLTEGQSNRIVAAHNLNAQSSRSHMLVMADVMQRSVDGSIRRSRLNFGDLAGSEDLSKSLGRHHDPELREESIAINSSLSALTTVMTYLSKGKRPSYRESPLTHILKDSLGGNSKTVMFVACSPHIRNRTETIRTLRFASCAKKIKNKAKRNEELCTDSLKGRVKELEAEILKLEARLLEERTKKMSLVHRVSKLCLRNRSSALANCSPAETASMTSISPQTSNARISRQSMSMLTAQCSPKGRQSSRLLQSVTESVACATVGSPGGSIIANEGSMAMKLEVNEYEAVLAVDALLKECSVEEDVESLNNENIQIIHDLRHRLSGVLVENQNLNERIISKNHELRTISDRMESMEEMLRTQLQGLAQLSRQVSRQESVYSRKLSVATNEHDYQWGRGVSEFGSQQLSDRPTVTDEDENSKTPMPAFPDEIPGNQRRPIYGVSDQFSQSHNSWSSHSHQLPFPHLQSPSPMNAQNVNVSNAPFRNLPNSSPSTRRLSLLQNKLLNYLNALQQQVDAQPFRNSRQSSVSTPHFGGARSSIASGPEFDVLNDDELAELVRINDKGRRQSDLSQASNQSQNSMTERDQLADLVDPDQYRQRDDMTRIRQKRIVERRKQKGQIRRASAPVLPASLLDELGTEIMISRNSILAPINENASVEKSNRTSAQSRSAACKNSEGVGITKRGHRRQESSKILATRGKPTAGNHDDESDD